MQHCEQPIYSQESFCGQCGEQVESSQISVKGIEQVNPEAMQHLRSVYPNARVVSGKVISTYYYKRTYRNNNNNLTYGYWWIELKDEKGQIESASIEAEDEFFNSIKKGDVLTLLYPVGYTLNYKIADRAARNIVKHNSMPLCVVNHLPTQQRSIRHEALNPSPQASAWLWFLLWVAVAAAAYFGLGVRQPGYAIGAGAVAALLCYLWERGRNRDKYERDQHRFKVLRESMKKLLGVSREDMGYHLQQRPGEASDINCTGCQARIPGSLNYCVKCGCELQNQLDDIRSIADQETALMSEYCQSYTEDYLHKNLLSSSPKGQVKIESFMAKVLSKDVESDVSDISITTTQTTRTDHYYGNRFSHSTTDTRTRTDRTRDSGISGNVWLLRENGDKVQWEFSEQVLGDLDIGDWVFFAYSDVNIGSRHDRNRECAINLSKDRSYSTRSFAGISGLGSQGLWWVMAIFFAVWCYSDFREPLYPILDVTYNSVTAPLYEQRWFIDFLPLILFGLMNIYFVIHSNVYAKRNRKRQNEILAPMRSTIEKVRSNMDKIKQQIQAWG